MTILVSSPSVDLVPWIGGAAALYLCLVGVAVVLCAAARRGDERLPPQVRPGVREAGPPLEELMGARTPERFVAQVAGLLGADAALFGWDARTDGLRLLAASRPGVAGSLVGRHLAREAVAAGRVAVALPPLVPPDRGRAPTTTLAVPASRDDARLGALCVSRSGARPFTPSERGLLVRLGALAADVLVEHAVRDPARGVPA
jgi:GAF domain-containing protein